MLAEGPLDPVGPTPAPSAAGRVLGSKKDGGVIERAFAPFLFKRPALTLCWRDASSGDFQEKSRAMTFSETFHV